jgi:hypothetical protein
VPAEQRLPYLQIFESPNFQGQNKIVKRAFSSEILERATGKIRVDQSKLIGIWLRS